MNNTKYIIDCFGYNKIYIPQEHISAENVITSTISPGYEHLLDDLLYSLHATEGDSKYNKIIFLINPDKSCFDIVNKWGCQYIICEPIKDVVINSKAVLYSLDEIVDFNKMLYLDSDTIILNPINNCFDALNVIPNTNILACKDFYFSYAENIDSVMNHYLYQSSAEDIDQLTHDNNQNIHQYPHIINAGVIASTPNALKYTRETMKNFYDIQNWINLGHIREQLAFNIALAKNNNLSVMHNKYNFQMVTGSLFELSYDLYTNSIRTFNYFEPYSEGWIINANQIIQNELQIDKTNMPKDQREQLLYVLNYLNSKFEIPELYRDINTEIICKNINTKSQINNKFNKSITPLCPRMLENENIHIIHFSGPQKHYRGLREICINLLHKKDPQKIVMQPYIPTSKDINKLKFCINTHKKYQDKTLPMLLSSMIDINHIPRENIIICSSGWDIKSIETYNGVTMYKQDFNAYEHTALITITEYNIEGEYWFNLHDTTKCGPNFYNIIKNIKDIYTKYDYCAINVKNILNMGIFSKTFLIKIKNYLQSLKNCSKQQAIMSEHLYPQLGKCYRICKNYELSLGYEQIYNDGVEREIRYFEELDLYKYQANHNLLSTINGA